MQEAARLLRLARCHLDFLAVDPRLAEIDTATGTMQEHADSALRDVREALLLIDRIGAPPHPLRRASDLATCDAGATAIEYALIAALVSVASIVALSGIGVSLNLMFMDVLRGLMP